VKRLRGIPVSPGSRIGRAVHHEAVPFAGDVDRRTVPAAEVPRERARLSAAFEAASRGLDESRKALAVDPQVGSIFEVHRILLEGVRGEIDEAVVAGSSAEHAVATVLRGYANRLAEIADPLFSERRTDVIDVERRLLLALSGRGVTGAAPGDGKTPLVVVAEDLTPTEAAALSQGSLAALVLEHGGPTSHTAIIAKALGVPCVVGVGGLVAAVAPGAEVWVDGSSGLVVVEPDAKARAEALALGARHEADERALLQETGLPAETLDGHAVTLLANIEFPLEVASAAARGAAGIGLYRTEFLYEPSVGIPDEEAHLAAYRDALSRIKPGRLTIRTFDFGADKAAPGSTSEANPALGSRSLRWCFSHPEAFRPQLRALLRVAAEGDVRVMLPMVGGPEDVRHFRALLAEAAEGLSDEGVPHRDPDGVRVGAMIEIPAAAVMADVLAREVDFFSIGTNDLIQYDLAVDRTNEQVAPLFRPSHPSLLRLVELVVAAARSPKRPIPVTMCGEMGGEEAYTVLLLGLGVKEFSLTPTVIPRVRRLVRRLTLARARFVAARCRRFDTPDEVDAFLHAALAERPEPAPAAE
jgi:phosphotransferase system enzyme I (PtsI)